MGVFMGSPQPSNKCTTVAHPISAAKYDQTKWKPLKTKSPKKFRIILIALAQNI